MGFYLLGGSLKRILEEQPPYPTHLLVRTLHSGGNFSKSQNLMNFANFPARVWVQGPGTTRAPTAQGGAPRRSSPGSVGQGERPCRGGTTEASAWGSGSAGLCLGLPCPDSPALALPRPGVCGSLGGGCGQGP